MGIEFKEELRVDVHATDDGYLEIRQDGARILISAGQVKKLLSWLEDGNGLSIEQDWNNGVHQVGD